MGGSASDDSVQRSSNELNRLSISAGQITRFQQQLELNRAESAALSQTLTKLEGELDDVNQNLDYGTLKGFSSLLFDNVIGIDDQDPQANLMMIPNKQLSRNDLNRKHALIFAQIEEVQNKRNALLAEISVIEEQLQNATKMESEEIFTKTLQQNLNRYEENQNDFWYGTKDENGRVISPGILLPGIILSAHKAEVYNATDQILALCNLFDENTDFKALTQAWLIVAQARDISASLNNPNLNQDLKYNKLNAAEAQQLDKYAKKYKEAADKFFDIYADHLPSDLQALKVLYQNDPESVDMYLDFLDGIQTNKNYDINNPVKTKTKIRQYGEMLQSLQNDVQEVYRNRSLTEVRKISGFNSLPLDIQQQIADQQLYIDKLRFDLDSMPQEFRQEKMQQIDALLEKLNQNVKNSIINNQSNEKSFEEIKQQIYTKERELRNKAFVGAIKQDAAILGGGYGAGWILGSSLLSGAVISGILLKEAKEAFTMDLPQIQDEIKFAESVSPADYKFIQKEDNFWSKKTVHDINAVEHASLSDKVSGYAAQTAQDFVNKNLDEVQKRMQDMIDENVDKHRVNEVIERVNRGAENASNTLNIIGAASLSVAVVSVSAVSIVIPALWPLGIALGIGLVLGFGGLVAREVMQSNTPVKAAIGKIGSNLLDGFKSIGKLLSAPFVRAKPSAIDTITRRASEQINNSAELTFNPEHLRQLKQYDPDLEQMLKEYFNSQFAELKARIQKARYTDPTTGEIIDNHEEIEKIAIKLDKLTIAWKKLNELIPNHKEFCKYMREFLQASFPEERDRFKNMAQMQQAKINSQYDMSKERKVYTFRDDESVFNMDNERDFVQERRPLELLHMLKEKIDKIESNLENNRSGFSNSL